MPAQPPPPACWRRVTAVPLHDEQLRCGITAPLAQHHLVHARELLLLRQREQAGTDIAVARPESAEVGHLLVDLVEAGMIVVRRVCGRAACRERTVAAPLLAVLGEHPLAEGLLRHRVPLHLVQLAALHLLRNGVDRADVVQDPGSALVVADLPGQPNRAQACVVQGTPSEIGARVGEEVVLHVEAVLLRVCRELEDAVVLLLADLDRALEAGLVVDQHIHVIDFAPVRLVLGACVGETHALREGFTRTAQRQEHVPRERGLQQKPVSLSITAVARRAGGRQMNGYAVAFGIVLVHVHFPSD